MFLFGIPFGFLWRSLGFPVALQCFCQGVPSRSALVFLWFSTAFPLPSYGFPVVLQWFFGGFPLVFLWFSEGTPFVVHSVTLRLSCGSLLFSYGLILGISSFLSYVFL